MELEKTWGRILSIWWLLLWRGLLGGFMVGAAIGFVIGIVGSILGYPQASRLLVIQVIAAPAGLAWGLFVIRMALNKPYRDFRIALLPRNANHAEVFS